MNQATRQRDTPTQTTCRVAWAHELTSSNQLREIIRLAEHATRLDGHAIGFLPTAAWEKGIAQGHVAAIYNNDDLVGWSLYGTNAIRECRILQIWIRPDARLILHGRALVDAIEQRTVREQNIWCLRLWCADDLEANVFWPALGFKRKTWRWGRSNTRPRRHNLWLRHVICPPPLVGERAPTSGAPAERTVPPNSSRPHPHWGSEESRS